jgi:hypothetical protein
MRLEQLLIFSIFIIFLMGCNSNLNSSVMSMKELRTGVKGVSLSFLPNDNPIQVYQDDTFIVNMMLRNEGAYDSPDVQFLFGTESDYVDLTAFRVAGKVFSGQQITSALPEGKLNGKSPEEPLGEFTDIEADLHARKITLSRLQETLMSGVLCYEYGTMAETSVCVQPQNTMLGLQMACQPKDIVLGSQGAPLAVTKIEVKNSLLPGNKIRSIFKIYVENRGTGSVIYSGTSGKVCSSSQSSSDVWNYFIARVTLGSNALKCQLIEADVPGIDNAYKAKLKNGKAEFICTAESPPGVSYESPFEVDLSYAYTETISRKLNIERMI